jgi:hypothetical protein
MTAVLCPSGIILRHPSSNFSVEGCIQQHTQENMMIPSADTEGGNIWHWFMVVLFILTTSFDLMSRVRAER